MDEEIKAALTLLALLSQRSEEVIVTSTTAADELGRLGIKLPANTQVQPTVPQDSLVVASLVTTPLMFPTGSAAAASAVRRRNVGRPSRRGPSWSAPPALFGW